jgi:hypothetical protein
MLRAVLHIVALACAAVLATPAAAGTGLFVGFADDGPKWDGEASAAPARALGASAFRLSVPWTPGESAVSATTASQLDTAIANTYGLRVVFAVYAESANDAPVDPGRRAEFCAFTRSLIERYPTVNDVVIWNEPNSSRFWAPQFNANGTGAAPAAYAALLAACWDELHAFRNDVNVLGPATSAHGFDEHAAPRKSHSPVNFIIRLGEAYRASGRPAPIFDTVAHHAYGLSSIERPWKSHAEHVIGLGDWAKLVGAYRDAFADTPQPSPGECVRFDCVGIWYLETGFQVAVPGDKLRYYRGAETGQTLPAALAAGADSATEGPAPDQATQIIDAVRLAYCQPYVEGYFNFLLRDEQDLRGWQSGVQWADGTWKPSLPAFKQAIREANDDVVRCGALKGGPIAGADATPPAQPSGLSAGTVDAGISLRWRRGTDRDLAGYYVYRSEASTSGYTRLTDLVAAIRFVDETAEPGVTYSYYVAAIDSAGNEGALSEPVPSQR